MEKIAIRNESEVRLIDPEKLLAVTVVDYLCTFHVESDASVSCTKSLKDAQALLPGYFIQISRSCIVNIDKIISIELKTKKVIVSGGIKFTVNNKKAFKDILSEMKVK